MSKVLGLRITDEERAEWIEQAKQEGFSNLATWVKSIVRKYILQQKGKLP